MTRANFDIISGYPKKHCFEKGGDGYFSGVMEDIFKFIHSVARFDFHEKKLMFWDRPDSGSLSEFIKECCLTLGHVANFSYFYEIDFNKQTFKAWDYATRWVNAPEDWEARGWQGCYKGKNQFAFIITCSF